MKYDEARELRRAAKRAAQERRKAVEAAEKHERELEHEAIKFMWRLGEAPKRRGVSRHDFRLALQEALAGYFIVNPAPYWRATFPRTAVLVANHSVANHELLVDLGHRDVLRFIESLAKEGFLGSRIEGNTFADFFFCPRF